MLLGTWRVSYNDNCSIYQEDIKVINLYTPKNRVPNIGSKN